MCLRVCVSVYSINKTEIYKGINFLSSKTIKKKKDYRIKLFYFDA